MEVRGLLKLKMVGPGEEPLPGDPNWIGNYYAERYRDANSRSSGITNAWQWRRCRGRARNKPEWRPQRRHVTLGSPGPNPHANPEARWPADRHGEATVEARDDRQHRQ